MRRANANNMCHIRADSYEYSVISVQKSDKFFEMML